IGDGAAVPACCRWCTGRTGAEWPHIVCGMHARETAAAVQAHLFPHGAARLSECHRAGLWRSAIAPSVCPWMPMRLNRHRTFTCVTNPNIPPTPVAERTTHMKTRPKQKSITAEDLGFKLAELKQQRADTAAAIEQHIIDRRRAQEAGAAAKAAL